MMMMMKCIWVDQVEHLGSEGAPTCRRSLLNCCGELFIVRDTSDSREENEQFLRCLTLWGFCAIDFVQVVVQVESTRSSVVF
jgi:hypothetical protein